MRIIVTDVTEMHNDHICVAGWCQEQNRMVRPLLAVGTHWDAKLGQPQLFWLGNEVEFNNMSPNNRGLPHSREDLVANPLEVTRTLQGIELATALAPSESANVAAAFDNQILNKRYVPGGSNCPSLGAIRVRASDLHFETRESNGVEKLRCWFYSDNVGYNLPVVSIHLLQIWRADGLEGLSRLQAIYRQAHVRLGLTNPFKNGQCILMINNILFY